MFNGLKINYTAPDYYVNPEDKGQGLPLFLVKLWPGHGYFLTCLLVFAEDVYDAMDKAFEYSEAKGWEETMTAKEAREYAEWGADTDDDIDELMDSVLVSNSDDTIYARAENFFIDEVPDDIEHL
ncbi:MAG: hypothetical protein J6Y37_13615 [Paludibacteraceae bacterium]|nr:hypothetical protein [Paludibacteraceae bacterium]